MDAALIETHPLPPFLPPQARLLMLGSFPPPRARWKMDFYYPNLQNDMWRIFGQVFFRNPDYFLSADGKGFNEALLRAFLSARGIAIGDAAHRVLRLQSNAADRFLRVLQPLDLAAVLAQIPQCHTLLTTGDKATETLLSLLPENTVKPIMGAHSTVEFTGRCLRLYRLPSSSRAYPLALARKAAVYGAFFAQTGFAD